MDLDHPLGRILHDAANGTFPPADGSVRVVPPGGPGDMEAIVELTGTAFVATTLSEDEVLGPDVDGFGGVVHPDVQRRLAGPNGWIGAHDMTLVRRGTGDATLPARPDLADHPRIVFGGNHRRVDLVHGDERGVVGVGRGLCDRWEVGLELAEDTPAGRGHGRELVRQAVGLVPEGEWLFAEIAPGNAASVRAFLAVGFVPIGAQVRYRPGR